MTRLVRTLVLIGVSIASGKAADSERSRLTIEVWNPANERIEVPQIKLVEVGTKQELIPIQHDGALEIPYGEYSLSVSAPGYRRFEQYIRIYQSEVYRRISLSVANSRYQTLAGIVKSQSPSSYWVRLISLSSNNTNAQDAKIKPDGSFQFAGLDGGDYLILVLRDGVIVASVRQHSVLNDHIIEINLK